MKRVDYHEPTTLEEAVQLMTRYPDTASFFAGGTDLLVELREQTRRADHVVNLKRIPDLGMLTFDPRAGVHCGALVTVRTLENAPFIRAHYAGLWQAARELASIPVRERATLAGNVCRASPSADTLPPLIADQAVAHVYGPAGRRDVTLEDFFLGPGRTVLSHEEVLTGFSIPAPEPGTGKSYIKHGRRKAMELATVGVAVTLTLDGDSVRDLRIVLGAVAPTPIRAPEAEQVLIGKRPEPALIEQAAEAAIAGSRPISDVRSSADYRRRMVGVQTRRALQQALEAAR